MYSIYNLFKVLPQQTFLKQRKISSGQIIFSCVNGGADLLYFIRENLTLALFSSQQKREKAGGDVYFVKSE